ncbi:MAG: cyclase family protein [Atribacterota bacterium]
MTLMWNGEEKQLIDLSLEVVPPGTTDRPFVVEQKFLSDKTIKNEIFTHSHVGTHIESPAHYFKGGKDLSMFPLSAFYGRAWFLDVEVFTPEHDEIQPEDLFALLGEVLAPGDIVIGRNRDKKNRKMVQNTGRRELLPSFSPEAAIWLRDREVKMVGIDHFFHLGKNVEKSRLFHDILLSRDILLIEGLDHLEEVKMVPFFLVAFPYRVRGMESSFARAVAFVGR